MPALFFVKDRMDLIRKTKTKDCVIPSDAEESEKILAKEENRNEKR